MNYSFLLVVLLVWMMFGTFMVVFMLERAIREMRSATKELKEALDTFRVRQGTITKQKVSRGNPIVDARARTVVRDTDDLPTTGRMSVGMKRKKTTNNARQDSDS